MIMTTSGTIGMLLHHKGTTVWSVAPNATVYEAIEILAVRNIGALPVVDEGRLVGIFSERDYTRKIALEGRSSRDTRVAEVVSNPVFSVTPSHTIEDSMRLMTDKHIRHLPVLENGRLVGMISIGDIVGWIILAQTAAIRQMEDYIAGR
jgi:CBS domain-containing protein